MTGNGSTDVRRAWNVREHLKPLEGWLLTDDAATYLGISREAVHRLIKRGTIKPKDARILGLDPARRPVIVIRQRVIEEMPVSPQRAREIRLRGELPGGELSGAELGDDLSEG